MLFVQGNHVCPDVTFSQHHTTGLGTRETVEIRDPEESIMLL
jgi:hypothetical protein